MREATCVFGKPFEVVVVTAVDGAPGVLRTLDNETKAGRLGERGSLTSDALVDPTDTSWCLLAGVSLPFFSPPSIVSSLSQAESLAFAFAKATSEGIMIALPEALAKLDIAEAFANAGLPNITGVFPGIGLNQSS